MPEPVGPLKVKVGCLVELELLGERDLAERLTLTLVADEQADFEAGFLGLGTPLAKVILGRFAGQILPYRVGDLKSVKILSVQPCGQAQTEDVAARRQATLEQAVKHSDYVNTLIFAGSYSSKWGDYDIDKLDPSQWETGETK